MVQPPQPANRSSLGSRLAMIALVAVLMAGVFAYSTLEFGLITGEEFSPFSFQRRSFWYYEVPLVGIQVSPISHDDTTGDLETYLVAQKLVAPQTLKAERWDLIQAHAGRTEAAQGDAAILHNYLVAGSSGKDAYWLKWTKDHPEKAKHLWSAVSQLAEQELYMLIPEVIDAAGEQTDLVEMEKQIDTALQRQYFALATAQHQLGRHEEAVELYSEVLSRAPEYHEALTERADCYSQLGQDELARADTEAAAKLKNGAAILER